MCLFKSFVYRGLHVVMIRGMSDVRVACVIRTQWDKMAHHGNPSSIRLGPYDSLARQGLWYYCNRESGC